MVDQMRALAIVLLLAAVTYVLYLWSKRKNQIECPSCGGHVNIYADECPRCGHEKGAEVDTTPVEDVGESTDEATEEEENAVDTAEPAEPPGSSPAPAAATTVQETEEETASDEFTCDECGEAFDSERGLKIHTGMKH